MTGDKPLANARHEAFAQALAQNKSQTDAAKEANYNEKWAGRNATRLTKNDEIAARVAYLKQQAADKALVTAEDVLKGLKKEAELYGEGASHAARVSAWEKLGKYLGLFTDKVDLTSKGDKLESNVLVYLPDNGRNNDP